MRLQLRVSLLLAVVAAVFALTVTSLRLGDLRATALSVERTAQERDAQLDNLLTLSGQPLQLFAQEYSTWDQMIAFVGTRDAAWARDNIEYALPTLKVQAAWVFDREFQQVYGINLVESSRLNHMPVPSAGLATLVTTNRTPHFFFAVTEGLFEVRGAPIRATDAASATEAGWLFVARRWDDAHLRSLGELTGSTVFLTPTDAEPAESIQTGSINLHRPLPGWEGRPVRFLHSHHLPPALDRLLSDNRADLWIVVTFGAALLAVFSWAITRWVLRPLRALTSSLEQRDATRLLDAKTSSAEFQYLAQLVETSFSHRAALEREVDERKRAESALSESERRYAQLIENSHIGIYRTTADGTLVTVNPAFAAMLGFRSAEEPIGRRLYEFDRHGPSSWWEFKQLMERTGEVRGRESEWQRRDGRILIVRENASAIRDTASRIAYFEGTVEDVTEHRRAEQATRQLFAVFNSIEDAVMLADFETLLFTYVNDGAVRQLGYTRDELLRMTPAEIDPDTTIATLREMNAAFRRGERTNLLQTTRHRRKDGTFFPVEVRIQYFAPAGAPAVCLSVARDLTERKAQEQQRVRTA